ncbi:MAG: outer membrane protein assembly factor BamD [Saprospiraceae bacterium]
MKKSILFLAILITLISCKSEFESVRTSNDPALIYQKALDFYDKEDWIKAQTLLELSIPNYRGKDEAEELFFKYAMAHYLNDEYILSAHYFKSFATTFYNSDKREEAEFMSAYSNFNMSPNAKLDQTNTEKAIEGFQLFINAHPKSERVEECNNLIDKLRVKLEKKAFMQGDLYYNIGQYQSAVKSFENMLNDFPDSKNSEQVRFLMLKSSYRLAEKSVYSKKEERYSAVVALYNKFIKKHPTSKYKKEAVGINKNTQKELKKLQA